LRAVAKLEYSFCSSFAVVLVKVARVVCALGLDLSGSKVA